ncbi:membrane protein [Echinicola pacifica]|uniref:Membrane protein n=1 Tax=Echinicola pacifica TaxID=346377 RepID=A0A918PNH7_9BACT|nr:DUF417 family protein [Echinicola pacifica]GGZ16135.1 membrane protein [Echinicola pacifica]
MKKQLLEKLAYLIGVAALVLPLLWIGIFKFTPTEAAAIKHLVVNHFAMGWMYSVTSDQGVSNIIGVSEILVAIGLILSFWNSKIGRYAAMGSTIIFITTLSFMFTTPGVWKTVDGILLTDFFILKDLGLLALSLWVWAKNS